MVTSIEAVIEFKRPLFQLELNTKQWWAFTRYPVNALENGDFNRARKSYLSEYFKQLLVGEENKKVMDMANMRSVFAAFVFSSSLPYSH